jgi:hypothetical protein
MPIAWTDRIANLRKALGRNPTIDEMLDAAQIHQTTLAEMKAQRESLIRG